MRGRQAARVADSIFFLIACITTACDRSTCKALLETGLDNDADPNHKARSRAEILGCSSRLAAAASHPTRTGSLTGTARTPVHASLRSAVKPMRTTSNEGDAKSR